MWAYKLAIYIYITGLFFLRVNHVPALPCLVAAGMKALHTKDCSF